MRDKGRAYRRSACEIAGFAAILSTLVAPSNSWAQVPPPLPGLVPNVPAAIPRPPTVPTLPTTVGPEIPAPAPVAPGPTPPVNVTIRSVTVSGAKVLPQAELQAHVAGLVSPSTPLARIEAARVDLLNAYRSAGYVLTTVTAAIDAAGNLRFVIVEGRIVDVKLEGDIGPAGVQVLRFLDHLTELPAVDTASLERWLLLANDVPGVTVHAILRPSPIDPGALTLVAQVSRQKVSALGSIDNRAYPLTGPIEFLGIVDLNSFSQFGERTELSYYRTQANTQNFGTVTEEFFTGSSGLKVRLYAGYGVSNPSGYLAAIGYQGRTAVGGLAASYPAIRSREQNLNVSAYLDIEQSQVLTTQLGTSMRAGEDDIQVGRIGADYNLQDVFAGDSRPALNTASVRISHGLPFLGGTQTGSTTATRVNENTGFTKISGELVRTQTLFSPWNEASVALKLLLAGQGSPDILPPVEKFYLGGSQFTRGYYAGQATGDSALAATAELDLNTQLDTIAFDYPLSLRAQWYMFYDWGEAWQNTSLEPNFHLSSEGIGVRVAITRYIELDVEGVIRNNRLPEGTPGSVKPIPAEAGYWGVLARF